MNAAAGHGPHSLLPTSAPPYVAMRPQVLLVPQMPRRKHSSCTTCTRARGWFVLRGPVHSSVAHCLSSHTSAPRTGCSTARRGANLRVVDKQVHIRPKCLHVPAQQSGQGGPQGSVHLGICRPRSQGQSVSSCTPAISSGALHAGIDSPAKHVGVCRRMEAGPQGQHFGPAWWLSSTRASADAQGGSAPGPMACPSCQHARLPPQT